MIACITNFSSEPRPDHQIGLPTEGVWKEILNTDAEVYDGTGLIGNLGLVVAHPVPSHGYAASASVTIPPLGAVWLRLEPELDEEQAIEPEKATRAVRAAAKVASPHATTADGALTATPRPRRARPAETGQANRAEPAQPAVAGAAAAASASAAKTTSAESPEVRNRRNRKAVRTRPSRRAARIPPSRRAARTLQHRPRVPNHLPSHQGLSNL